MTPEYQLWEARQREMRSLEDFHRAPYGADDLDHNMPYEGPFEEPDLTPEVLFEREYEDDDRIADMEMDAAKGASLDSPTGMSDHSVAYWTAMAAAYRSLETKA